MVASSERSHVASNAASLSVLVCLVAFEIYHIDCKIDLAGVSSDIQKTV